MIRLLLLVATIAAFVSNNDIVQVEGFAPQTSTLCFEATTRQFLHTQVRMTEGSGDGDNKAMAFLRKIGKVGGANNQDFINAMGVDEGPAGKSMGSGENSGKVGRWDSVVSILLYYASESLSCDVWFVAIDLHVAYVETCR